jgi:hypothetical protein
MKLKYCLEFTERVDDINLTDDELSTLKNAMESHLHRFIIMSGVNIEDFKLEFDLED